jgi:dynein heavy chain
LVTGDTGTGKSVAIAKQITNVYAAQLKDDPVSCNNKDYMPVFINFSARTSANQTQDIIDGKLSKRRKGVFGPPLGKTCIIFVDDLNMPIKEVYGAQPPIEILRQWMTQGGWYDRKETSLIKLVDLQFVAAMGPPGGGRTRISQRYRRHYNILGMIPFDSTSLEKVFSTIVDWFLAKFPGPLRQVSKQLVAATIDMYNSISASLKPTPAKLHYTFNLRDVSKVFQGLSMSHPKHVDGVAEMIRLWGHENMRVFHDRLINEEDRAWFHGAVAEKCKKHFKQPWDAVRGKAPVLIYTNFHDTQASERVYQEAQDHEELSATMYELLGDYNNMNKTKMNLVLFGNAIEHVARIGRILAQPRGNALLVGVGGSGRKSLTRLAAFVQEMSVFMIEISKTYGKTEWRDDLKEIFRRTGMERKQVTFLFNDTQIKMESFVEDINNILNTGEVPNLFEKDEMIEIVESCQKRCAETDGYNADIASEVYSFFVDTCKENLHVVLAFSPVGDSFRERLLMFPSLVNCCTIDWFTAWPESALRNVATKFFADVEFSDDSVRDGVVNTAVFMQSTSADLSERFLAEMGRYYYITPTSYLELISTFKDLIGRKAEEVKTMKSRYDNGLTKIADTAAQVGGMKEELIALQPKLEEATIETDAMIVKITKMAADAAVVAEKVAKDKAGCDKQAAAAKAIKDDCEAELAVAIPALNAAVKALDTLKKSDITEVKSMKTPPSGVVLTMGAVCIMFGIKPDKIKNPSGFGKVDDFWGPAKKKVLTNTKLIQDMKEYDKDNIPEKIMKKIAPMKDDPDFQPAVIERQSKAAAGMCQWVHALIVYDRVAKIVEPKRIKLKESEGMLADAMADLAVKEAELKAVEDRVQALKDDLEAKKKKKDDLAFEVKQCEDRLQRAESLINGLGGEQKAWKKRSEVLGERLANITGDVVIASGTVAYLGPFSMKYRRECIAQWSENLRKCGVTCSETFDMQIVLGSAVQTREWTLNKLPNDAFSIDNAIILDKSARWPLMIDPQGQANRWVRNMEKETEPPLKICKQNEATFVRTIENAISFGSPVLLENVPVELDPVLESILARQVIKSGGVNTIRVGDTYVEYDERFKLYITTKLPNPHYPPEICVQVNLLNFVATQEGLEDQMLGIVVAAERPELETQRQQLVVQDAENQRRLTEIEDDILRMLASAEGNILDDEALIEALGESKRTSDEIMAQVKVAQRTAARIDETRAQYQPVAFTSSNVFFCIADLCNVDPMYQYSLEFFINLFLIAIDRARKAKKVSQRVDHLNRSMLKVLYANICRSLFEKDKLLFSFLVCSKLLTMEEKISPAHLRFFVQGSTEMKLARPNPCKQRGSGKWLSDKNWGDVLALSELKGFGSFATEMAASLSDWAPVMTGNENPVEIIRRLSGDAYPHPFHQAMILRCLRPDYVTSAVQDVVIDHMGREFVEPPSFDLEGCFEDSSCTTPLIFVLAPGADPVTDLLNFAAKRGFQSKLLTVSLGQGQGPIAQRAVEEAVDKGSWACLQNCHLCKSWMPSLEKIVEELDPARVHASFRLWLTSMPASHFPVAVLQNGVKMTKEAPKGIRASLLGTYSRMDPNTFEGCRHPGTFKKMLFGLSFFHALVRERCSYGPLGWNIPYAFSEPDLRISMDQLRNLLDENETVPYAALNYLVSECNYGGRVTDDKDRRCIKTILTDFYTPDINDPEYKFSESGLYFSPAEGPVEGYLKYIKELPLLEGPEIFGMHNNASITSATQQTNYLFGTILSLLPAAASEEGMTWEDSLAALAQKTEERIPDLYDIEKVVIDYPISYNESMNTVLVQELERFNRLVKTIKSSLRDVQRAITGEVVMSRELLQMGRSMTDGLVPTLWAAVAYPSLMPLGSWVNDLLQRLEFFDRWIEGGVPAIFWISGFFFTQAFLTGTRQNFARKYTIPIDLVQWDFEVLTPDETHALTARAADGAYVTGMFLDGAGWSIERMSLCESKPKVLYMPMMTVLILPLHMDKKDRTKHVYRTPLYKTSERRGMLSTTGHSTNFVLMFELPMQEKHDEKHWIKRGVAMLTQLDD